jgi:hypothetical protein
MRLTRFAFLALLVGAIPLLSGCGSNKDKLVGKWKMVSATHKDGKVQNLEDVGMIMEFTADGNIKVGMDPSKIPPGLKEMMEKSPEGAAKLTEMQQVGKYKVSGDTIELEDMKKGGDDSPFGKNNRGKLKFEGDTVTLSGDDGSLKLSRIK